MLIPFTCFLLLIGIFRRLLRHFLFHNCSVLHQVFVSRPSKHFFTKYSTFSADSHHEIFVPILSFFYAITINFFLNPLFSLLYSRLSLFAFSHTDAQLIEHPFHSRTDLLNESDALDVTPISLISGLSFSNPLPCSQELQADADPRRTIQLIF